MSIYWEHTHTHKSTLIECAHNVTALEKEKGKYNSNNHKRTHKTKQNYNKTCTKNCQQCIFGGKKIKSNVMLLVMSHKTKTTVHSTIWTSKSNNNKRLIPIYFPFMQTAWWEEGAGGGGGGGGRKGREEGLWSEMSLWSKGKKPFQWVWQVVLVVAED